MNSSDWLVLDKYDNTLCVHDKEHPFHDAYVNATNKYCNWLISRMPTLEELQIGFQARHNVKLKQYEEYYRLRNLNKPNEVQQLILAERNSLGEKVENNINKPYIWLCVNPNSTYTFNEFKALVQKMVSKVWLKSYVYVYEQRGITEQEAGKGFHLHAIIKRPEDKKPSHCIRELSNTFKKCCDVSNYHFFQTKFIDEDEYQRKLEYILGLKDSNEENQKDLKQNIDKYWRGKYLIKPFYFLNIDIGKYAT